MRNVLFFRSIVVGIALTLGTSFGGCQGGSDEDLGTIIHEIPQVPGSEKPFPMPGLETSTKTQEEVSDPSSAPN